MYGCVSALHKQTDLLNILLIYLKSTGIKNYKDNDCYGDIEFNDGTKLHFWNTNKWYAWMSRGDIHFSNGEFFNWNEKMPNYEVLYHFKKEIQILDRIEKQKEEEIEKQKIKQMMNNAPITYIRKQKLKKLGLFKSSK